MEKNTQKSHRLFPIFSAIVICVFLLVATAPLIYYSTISYEADQFHSKFKVFYSLDKKENDQEVAKVIGSASQYIYFAIYEFTLSDIADALIQAKRRGVTVAGIMDLGNTKSDPLDKAIFAKLQHAGIKVETEKHPQGIMHIKALASDNAYILGSYNWTRSATDYNDELLEIGTDDYLRGQYVDILKRLIDINK